MLAAAAATVFACLAPGVASADTVIVTTTDDIFSPCTPTDCTLRGALAEPAGTVIVVPAGDYELTAELTSNRDLTIQGAGPSTRLIAVDDTRVLNVLSDTLTVSDVEITGGVATDAAPSFGGGALVAAGATLRLTDSTITDNEADNAGGIWVEGSLVLTRSTVSGNDALAADPNGLGGGIGVGVTGGATLENSTVSGNTANNRGGGIHTANVVIMRNVTIAQNQALGTPSFGAGGGIRQDFGSNVNARTFASNVLLAANVGFSCGGTTGAAGFIQSVNGMSDDPVATPSCNVDPARNTLVSNAMIGSLANNGGPTRTHALLAGSPAIGAGAGCLANDQRSLLRGSVCDIGAFEFGTEAPPPPPPPPQPSPQELPPPVAGQSVNALTKSGTVKVKLPGTNAFVVLGDGQQIPVGTIVDARKGRVTLVAASNKSGGTATSDFYDGVFKVGQTKGSKPITTLKLVEKLSCPKRGKASVAAKRKKRRLWGDGKGRFRTQGSYSSATVRGTRWLTEDTCTSTVTRVVRGSVTVRDLAGKTVIVRAGKKYVAKRKP